MKYGTKTLCCCFVSLQQSLPRKSVLLLQVLTRSSCMQCLRAAKPYQPASWGLAHCKGILNACYMVTPANLMSTD